MIQSERIIKDPLKQFTIQYTNKCGNQF